MCSLTSVLDQQLKVSVLSAVEFTQEEILVVTTASAAFVVYPHYPAQLHQRSLDQDWYFSHVLVPEKASHKLPWL